MQVSHGVEKTRRGIAQTIPRPALSDLKTRSSKRAGSLVVLLQRLEPSTLHPRQARATRRTP
uniref:Uncharacterized protein n=1 Tax=Siphoviridae sp. ctGkF2 TaxID=2827823 RepID=A0A8S5TKZ9_9CAUD|nr:MAG TPA: hypothetical protein [Siphoviridae sp. ctGkF2]